MPATREDLVKLVREVIVRTDDQHEYFGNRAAFDPHEWVLEALKVAYERGSMGAFDRGYSEGYTTGLSAGSAICPGTP